MHELGIVFEIVKRVTTITNDYDIAPEDLAIVVVECGEASTIIPKYLKECWPAAIDRTPFEHVELQVEEIVATVKCNTCGHVYEYLNNDRKCPECGDEYGSLVTGKEFNIKEILLFEDEDDMDDDDEYVEYIEYDDTESGDGDENADGANPDLETPGNDAANSDDHHCCGGSGHEGGGCCGGHGEGHHDHEGGGCCGKHDGSCKNK